MNEPLIVLINYLRNLATAHVEIKSFGIAEYYDLNDSSNFQYPLLFLELPISSQLNADGSKITINFNLHAFTNIIQDSGGNNIQVTASMIQDEINQIGYTDLALQDQLMNNAYRIITTICTKMLVDTANRNLLYNGERIPFSIESISISNAERVTTKDLYQATASISVSVVNFYKCPIESYFDFNK